MQLPQLGTMLATPVATAFHRHSQRVRASETADEDRYQKAPQLPPTVKWATTIDRRSTGRPCRRQSFGLVGKYRNELECNRPHQRQFVHRKAKSLQRVE